MGETQKPFACNNANCDMTFTNEDHLNIHQKKHDMSLSLEINEIKNGYVADQTPTPTRFIRNCEEVGLFQDLQNVNPFEETFRKAVENGKVGNLHVPEESTDDTLHTPQIYPPIEETRTNYSSISRLPSLDENLLPTNSNVPQPSSSPSQSSTSSDNEISTKKFVIDLKNSLFMRRLSNKNEEDDVKLKIKEAIKSRLLQVPGGSENNQENGSPRKRPASPQKSSEFDLSHQKKSSSWNVEKSSTMEKRRAINRAAQSRSRARKKCWLDNMEKKMEALQVANDSLCLENNSLKSEIELLKSIILSHEDCIKAKDPTISDRLKNFSHSQLVSSLKSSSTSSSRIQNTEVSCSLLKNGSANIKNNHKSVSIINNNGTTSIMKTTTSKSISSSLNSVSLRDKYVPIIPQISTKNNSVLTIIPTMAIMPASASKQHQVLPLALIPTQNASIQGQIAFLQQSTTMTSNLTSTTTNSIHQISKKN